MWGGGDTEYLVAFTGESFKAACNDALRGIDDGLQTLARLVVHPSDRGAWEHVVELHHQKLLPEFAKCVTGVGHALLQVGPDRPDLGLAQQDLRAAMQLFDLSLGGQGPAVVLQVELAGPQRRVGSAGGFEERRDRAVLQPGQPEGVIEELDAGGHLPGRASPAVAESVEEQTLVDALLGHLGPGLGELGGQHRAAVVVRRGEVGEQPRPVQTLPQHRGVREDVDRVP